MDFSQVIAPSSEADFLELGRTRQGRLFRKHILNKGDLIHPLTGAKIPIDDDFIAHLTENFANGVCDIVQVPKAGPKNEHTEDPDRNIGEVIGIEEKDGKIYAIFDARADADKLGVTLLGASAMMHMNYTDTRTGKKVGPTLLHMAVTNRPYVTNLDDYEELVAASVEDSGDTVMLENPEPEPEVVEDPVELTATLEDEVVTPPEAEEPAEVLDEATDELDPEENQPVTSEENTQMTLDEMVISLRDDFGIDVVALQDSAAQAEGAMELSNTLAEALTGAGILKLSNGEEVQPDDIVGAVAELAQENVQLTGRLDALEESSAKSAAALAQERAENLVDTAISEGRILPANRDSMIELRLSNEALFDRIVPDEAVVALATEQGAEPHDDAGTEADIDAEILRYSQQAAAAGYSVTKA